MVGRIKKCKYCDKEGHTAFNCFSKPRKQPKRTKLNKRGKHAKKWSYTRSKWLEQHPPDFDGYWYCYICKKALTIETLTLDHVRPRSSNPELRYEMHNIKPCCSKCQFEKGSKSLENYIKDIS